MSQERRRYPRVPCVLPIRLTPLGEPGVIETLTKSLSVGGVRCLSPVKRPLLTPVSVELIPGKGLDPIMVSGKILWVEPVPMSEQFQLGIEFSNLKEQDSRRLSVYISKISSSNTSK